MGGRRVRCGVVEAVDPDLDSLVRDTLHRGGDTGMRLALAMTLHARDQSCGLRWDTGTSGVEVAFGPTRRVFRKATLGDRVGR